MASFKHIILATDFTGASQGALETALALAGDCTAMLTIVHTCDVPPPVLSELPDAMTSFVQRARSKLDDLVASAQAASPGARGILKVGVPWEQILAAAAESRSDLIVMGTHGRRGLEHAVMGSVAERVVQFSPIPVLTVPGRKAS